MREITKNDGKLLVKLARDSLSTFLDSGKKLQKPDKVPAKLLENSGVFVTINERQSGNLRGCIGLPRPTKPLVEGVIDAAIDAGIHDSRFAPVTRGEVKDLSFEVTVLTKPQEITARTYGELLGKIQIGTDGLIVERGHNSTLFLPQVPVEQHWDKDTYYAELCHKAGISLDSCKDLTKTRVSKFQGQIFAEK